MKGKQQAGAPWRCGYCHRTASYCRRRGTSPVCDDCRAHLAERGKKFCGCCRQTKPLDAFQRVGQGEQRRAVCTACQTEAVRERRTAYMRQWRDRNRAQLNESKREWEARNPERTRAWRRRSYLNQKLRATARLRAGATGS